MLTAPKDAMEWIEGRSKEGRLRLFSYMEVGFCCRGWFLP
ncbi:hypothetical protein CCP2SC5_100057 [Azospirillaceae bacterium]